MTDPTGSLLALLLTVTGGAPAPILTETFDTPASVDFFSVHEPAFTRTHATGSLRIELEAMPDNPRSNGLRRSLDVTPYRGHTLRFAIRARTDGTDPLLSGLNTWVRVEDEQDRPLHAKTWAAEHAGEPYRGREFAPVELVVRMPVGAARAWFVVDVGTGTTWLDDLVVERLELPPGKPISTAARDYLDAALGTLQDHFADADKVDWARVRELAYGQAGSAVWPGDTYGAIGLAIAQLPGRHTLFLSPQQAKAMQQGKRNKSAVGVSALGDVTLVRVPAYEGFEDRIAATRFAQRSLAALAQRAPATRGWIVDLRENGGGNMWPMLAAIEPLLGTEQPGAFVASADRTPWVVAEHVERAPDPPAVTVPAHAPLAVLIGPGTASSGEAVAIALHGRPNTRFFGASTAGFASANAPFPLSDGALLLVTTSRMADRRGHVYTDRIAPDETLDCGAPDADRCVARAREWLATVR